MRLGIDASNLRAGGGITHLREILSVLDPDQFGVDKILVWSGERTLIQLEDRPWLEKIKVPILNRALPFRTFWQLFLLDRVIKEAQIDLLFVPGGIYFGRFEPFITMSQNLLPFDDLERKRFGLSALGIKLRIIKLLQSMTFQKAGGLIFLTETAKDTVLKQVKTPHAKIKIINHGVSPDFLMSPREQKPLSSYSEEQPFKWLYVSLVSHYKHQWFVAEAVQHIKKKGYPVSLELIGSGHQISLNRLNEVIDRIDPQNDYISYRGPVAYSELKQYYHNADGFVYASSCETFGQILVEAMSSGLPIGCSNRSVLPEVLGNAGEYFDPEDPGSIAGALIKLMEDPDLRESYARKAFERSKEFSWERCSRETISFITSFIS
jgi:glycosyltransferase involved in cell wall biosynthesis